MRRRAISLVSAAAIAAGLAAPAAAATPSVAIAYSSSRWGVVSGNTVWDARAITIKASSTGAASTDRYVIQSYSSGTWANVPTKILSRTSSAVSVSFYPRWGTKPYRLALVRSTGSLKAKTGSWTAQGFKTVPLQRVITTAAPPTGTSVSAYGISLPALWSSTTGVPRGQQSATVASGLCRSYLGVAEISTSGAPDSEGMATMEAGYQQEPLLWVLNSGIARAASDPYWQTIPRVKKLWPVYPSETYFTWQVSGTSGPFPSGGWSGGLAEVGGAGLCVRALR